MTDTWYSIRHHYHEPGTALPMLEVRKFDHLDIAKRTAWELAQEPQTHRVELRRVTSRSIRVYVPEKINRGPAVKNRKGKSFPGIRATGGNAPVAGKVPATASSKSRSSSRRKP